MNISGELPIARTGGPYVDNHTPLDIVRKPCKMTALQKLCETYRTLLQTMYENLYGCPVSPYIVPRFLLETCKMSAAYIRPFTGLCKAS